MAETFCSCSHRASVEKTTLVASTRTRLLLSCPSHRRVFHLPSASLPKWLAQLARQPIPTPPQLLARAATKSANAPPSLTAQNNPQQSSSAPPKVRSHPTPPLNSPTPTRRPTIWEPVMSQSNPQTRRRFSLFSSRTSPPSSRPLFAYTLPRLLALTLRVCSTVCSHCPLQHRKRRRENQHPLPLLLHPPRRSASVRSSETLPNFLYMFSR